MEDYMMDGLTSNDCDKNVFCDFHLYFLKYCDGNSFSGTNSNSTVMIDGEEVKQFQCGHYIKEAFLNTITTNESYNIKSATEVLLTGPSAGGLSAIRHSDFFRNYFSW